LPYIGQKTRVFAGIPWVPNFVYIPGDRIKAGRPRFRRSRRVLTGRLAKVAKEAQR
jgi:hypothetical protein